MDEKVKNQAKKQAKTAATQAKNAVKNGTGAAELVGENVAEEAADRIDARAIGFGLGNVGQGFIALGVATYMGAVAFSKFQKAANNQ